MGRKAWGRGLAAAPLKQYLAYFSAVYYVCISQVKAGLAQGGWDSSPYALRPTSEATLNYRQTMNTRNKVKKKR